MRHNGKLVVGEAATGNVQQEWDFPSEVHDVAFDEKSLHLATVNANGTVFILRLEGAGSE